MNLMKLFLWINKTSRPLQGTSCFKEQVRWGTRPLVWARGGGAFRAQGAGVGPGAAVSGRPWSAGHRSWWPGAWEQPALGRAATHRPEQPVPLWASLLSSDVGVLMGPTSWE